MNVELVLRFLGGILIGMAAYRITDNSVDLAQGSTQELLFAYVVSSLSFAIGFLATPYVTTRPFYLIRRLIYHATAAEVIAGGLGLGAGLLVGAMLAFPLSFLPGTFGQVLPILSSVVLGYFGVMTMLTHRQGIFALVGLGGRSAGDESGGRMLLLDTSAIIDGRIADIGRTGFMGGKILVPRFVLEELQHIADSPEALRRNRGRRGLEVLNHLQKESAGGVEIADLDVDNAIGVDAKLVRLARTMSCPIITTDYNLNHVAQLQGVEVLNVNLLANAVRSVVLQGEELAVAIVQEGKEPGQGVAYLDDGTMVVVENGRGHLNNTVDVVVTKVLQTAAGRMVFARMKTTSNGHDRHQPS
jgi:uncharacterized protein YacL